MDNVTDKMNRLNALKGSKNMRHILEEAGKILGNPILAHDMEYQVLAMSQNNAPDDIIWNEFAATGTVGRERLEFYRDECFFETAANAKTVTFLYSDKLKYDRIYGKLFTKHHVQVGCACIVACHKPFAPEDALLFEETCDILNTLLANSRNFQRYGQEAMENLLCLVLENKIEDKLLYAAHVESLYIGLKNHLYIGVARLPGLVDKPADLRRVFRRICPMYKYALYGEDILVIMGTDRGHFDAKKDLPRLCSYFRAHNVHMGVSACFDNMFELGKHYRQALFALEEGLKNGDGGQNVHLFV